MCQATTCTHRPTTTQADLFSLGIISAGGDKVGQTVVDVATAMTVVDQAPVSG